MSKLNTNTTKGGLGLSPSGISPTGGEHRPLPAMLGRQDVKAGSWLVSPCRIPGDVPMTNISDRVMLVPTTDGELERSVRGHEMAHAKFSPSHEDMEKWVARGIATHTALVLAEEVRINYIANKAGYSLDKYLATGSETTTGTELAKKKDWSGCVGAMAATLNTAGYNKFITGVRRVDKEWATILRKIGTKLNRELRRADKSGELFYTDRVEFGEDDTIAPRGFFFSERIGEWLDRVATFPPPPPTPKGASKSSTTTSTGESDEKPAPWEEGKRRLDKSDDKGKASRDGNPNPIEIDPTRDTNHAVVGWEELRVSREPMPRYSVGQIGKKRIATNMGRRPRRIHRLMTDPAKRVFDRTTRGSGGMVIIDASGSMSFTTEQIAQITENAPGCTVAIYSNRGTNATNLWVIADKGRMVESVDYIDYGYGNGVDLPALEWGVRNRSKPKEPMVWVTDGGVTGKHDTFSDQLVMACAKFVMKHNIIVVPHVESAIAELGKLQRGGEARSHYPAHIRTVWRRYMNRELPR